MGTAKTLNTSALLVAVLGGVFFGLSSCGGYAWHKTVFFWVLAALTFAAVWFPVSVSRPFLARAGILVVVCFGYFLVEAIAGTLYPEPPDSWSQFWAGFRLNLVQGPC
jgi:hypothetical protein